MMPHRRLLKPGDQVQLNGKGPRMTVIKYISDNAESHSTYIVRCHWYDEEGEKSGEFHQNHLSRIPASSDDNAGHYKVEHDKLIDPNDPTPGRT